MASLCIPKEKIDALKQALKDKTLNIRELVGPDMTSEARTKIFSDFTANEGDAKTLNMLFEEKLVLKNRMLGIQNLFQKVGEFGKGSPEALADAEKARSEYRAMQQERIFSPKEHEAFLNDLASKKLGTTIPREGAQKVYDLSREVGKLQEASKEEPLGISAEAINKQIELTKYVNSFNVKTPFESIRDSAASIYKNLFIGVKTGIKTFTLGVLNSVIEVPIRRISSGKALGDVDTSVKLDSIYQHAKMFAKTGVNTIISTSPDDVFGDTSKGSHEFFGGKDTVKGDGVLPTVAKGINLASRGLKFVTIDLLHKVPMIATSAVNFADAADITSTQLAKMDIAKGADATAIFKDAMRVSPQTLAGKLARLRAQQDAFRVININNSPLAEATSKLQQSINKQIPTLGDYIIPMAKVPSNVIYNQIENFGVGLGTGTFDVIKGTSELNRLKSLGEENTSAGADAVFRIRDGVKTMVRTIGVMGAAAIITMNLNKKDFKIDTYGNSYVKLGSYWLNTDAFGGAGTAVSGMMMAKTGNTGMIFDYGEGGFSTLEKAPIVEQIYQTVQQGLKGQIGSALISSYINPVMAQDVEKSIQENNANPFFFGSLIQTQDQVNEQDKASALKAVQTKKLNAVNKKKGQSLF